MKMIQKFLKSETVLAAAFLAAVASAFFVPPNINYFSYLDYRVLSLLYCLMVVVSGFRNCGVFQVLAQRLCAGARSSRKLCTFLVLLCFFFSMVVTNDVALLTFVPFSILILHLTAQEHISAYVIILQTVAANLGSMATPVGNPQNLYLYSYYNMDIFTFLGTVLPIALASLIILLLLCRLIPAKSITVHFSHPASISSPRRIALYGMLFLLCLAAVLHIIHWGISLAGVVVVLILFDRKLLVQADFGLLATFVCFFIFVGNLGAMEPVKEFLKQILQGKEMLVSALASQVISNVPAAVLFSGFTTNGQALLLGTNIGGLGTPVASLASLISLKAYGKSPAAQKGRYLLLFCGVNIFLFILLLLFAYLLPLLCETGFSTFFCS